MPVVQLGCSGHNPQKTLVSLTRYPTLASFLDTLPQRFSASPSPPPPLPPPPLSPLSPSHAPDLLSSEQFPSADAAGGGGLSPLHAESGPASKTSGLLTYLENGQAYDIVDDEGWQIAVGDMESQAKPVLVWTLDADAKKGTTTCAQIAAAFGMDESAKLEVLTQLLLTQPANPPVAAAAAAAAAPGGGQDVPGPVPKRRRRSSKNRIINETEAPPGPIKRQQQQTELYRSIVKSSGHAAAFAALDKAWQDRFYILADIVNDIFGSRHYLLNPLEVACPLCLTCIKLSQICERRLGNLMHTHHHLRKVHLHSPVDVVRATTLALILRWEEKFGPDKTIVTPLTDDMRRLLADVDSGRSSRDIASLSPAAAALLEPASSSGATSAIDAAAAAAAVAAVAAASSSSVSPDSAPAVADDCFQDYQKAFVPHRHHHHHHNHHNHHLNPHAAPLLDISTTSDHHHSHQSHLDTLDEAANDTVLDMDPSSFHP
ncbi:hypothetical protein HDU86_006257 [Geranomyces michiganensis]|nr:hypothetical protein HDU86_006257 [Geranomyces michiganensis]